MLAQMPIYWLDEAMEKQPQEQKPQYKDDLVNVFGEDGTARLLNQITHDNSSLTNDEVLQYAWAIIPEASAYMMPADQDTLIDAAILEHENYEAHRRVSEL